MKTALKTLLSLIIASAMLLAGPMLMVACSSSNSDWRTADTSSVGVAPLPEETPEAVVQVWGARAFSWRGAFAVHTWIATKPANATSFTVHEVVGWGTNKVRSRETQPDRRWYGNDPALLADYRGAEAAAIIPDILEAIEDYPYQSTYVIWPGPNSNTFVSWVIRQVPEFDVVLPNNAIGKDYLGESTFVAATPSDSGYQVSLWGYLGVLASLREGLEINVLGLSFGVDPLGLGIKIPGVGQIGLRDPWMYRKPPLDDLDSLGSL